MSKAIPNLVGLWVGLFLTFSVLAKGLPVKAPISSPKPLSKEDVCLPMDIFSEALDEFERDTQDETFRSTLYNSYKAIYSLCAKNGFIKVFVGGKSKKIYCYPEDQI